MLKNFCTVFPIQYLIFVFCVIFSSLCSAQNSDFFMDKEHKMFEFDFGFFLIDTIDDNYIIGLNEEDADYLPLPLSDFIGKIKIISTTGDIQKEVEINRGGANLRNFYRTKNSNYIWIDHTYYANDHWGTYLNIKIYDQNLNTVDSLTHTYAISEPLTSTIFEETRGEFVELRDSIYFIIPLIVKKDTAEKKYFSITSFNKSGAIGSFRLQERDQIINGTTMRSPLIFEDQSFIIPNYYYFNKFDSLGNLIKTNNTKDLRQPFKTARNSVLYNNTIYQYGSGFYNGVYYFSNFVLKLDTQYHVLDSINLDQEFTRKLYSPLFDHDVPPGCFYLDEDNNLNAVSYYNGVGRSTILNSTPGRIFVSKFTPDLKVLCQETYENPDWKINISYGKYLGDGELLVTGMMDSIELPNASLNYHPFIAKIHDGCKLSWATNIQELANKPNPQFSGQISVLQNPVSDVLQLKYEGNPAHLKYTFIYDINGKLAKNENTWEQQVQEVNVHELSPGTYLFSVSDKNGAFYTGKFVKI